MPLPRFTSVKLRNLRSFLTRACQLFGVVAGMPRHPSSALEAIENCSRPNRAVHVPAVPMSAVHVPAVHVLAVHTPTKHMPAVHVPAARRVAAVPAAVVASPALSALAVPALAVPTKSAHPSAYHAPANANEPDMQDAILQQQLFNTSDSVPHHTTWATVLESDYRAQTLLRA